VMEGVVTLELASATMADWEINASRALGEEKWSRWV
jgi:hypothetical protein